MSIGQVAFLEQIYEVTMTFQVCQKKTKRPTQSRLRFDLEKLRNPDVTGIFQATIGGKFAPLTILRDDDIDTNSMITTYNKAVTDSANEILGKEGIGKALCNQRCSL